jgi:hypothetical protein
MARAHPIITNFTGGELSAYLDGRTDLSRYYNGARVCENFLCLPQGPADRRGGTRFINAAKHADKRGRLVPFEFSDIQAYVIEAGELYFRFYMDKGRIESGSGAYEVATPYAEADLAGLRWAQSADVMYLVHPAHRPRKLSRTGHTAWTLSAVDFVDGPWLDENVTTTTLTPSATSGGAITITASAVAGINGGQGFVATDVGRLVRMGHQASVWAASTAYVAGDVRRNSGNIYRCTLGGTSATSGGPTGTGSGIVDGTVTWEFVSTGGIQWGYAEITARSSATQVTASVRAGFAGTSATAAWRLGLWSDTTGWPAAVTIHDERLVFGSSTTDRPQRIDASKVGDFENTTPGTGDGDPLAISIGSNKVNKVRWLASMRVLLVGTVGAPFAVAADPVSAPLTPTNIAAKRQTANGCADIQPVEAGKAVLFVQQQRRKLLELRYSLEDDAYVANDLTLLAEQATRSGIVELVYQSEPNCFLWACRVDGQLVACTYLPEQDITAWHRHPLADGGRVESLAVIPGGTGSDQLWLLVAREVGGQTVRYIEILEEPLPLDGSQADAYYVDCGLSYEGPAVTSLGGLDHLEGKTVQILADGGVHPERVVTGGAVALDWAATKVHAGLGYLSKLKPMRIEAGAGEGTAQGKKKLITHVKARLARSLGGQAGRDEDNLEPILQDRDPNVPMDEPMPLFSGDAEIAFPGNYDTTGDLLFVQDQPLPFTMNAIIPRVVTSDG